MLRICNFLNILYESNKANPRMSYKEFYSEAVNSNEEYKQVPFIVTRK